MDVLLYGATGYTGALIARAAAGRGLALTLAGRRADAVEALAGALGVPWRAASLEDAAGLDRLLAGHRLVLHCAGPYLHTATPMVEACLRTRTHYLDITGEIPALAATAARDAAARAAGIVLLPGVGFDVVPSDCLAVHLRRRLPEAASLTLAFRGVGGISRGTLLSAIAHLDQPGAIRRAGVLTPVPVAWRTRTVDFGEGRPRLAVSFPWGDVVTAHHSTGIGDIEVYMALPPKAIRLMRLARPFRGALASRPGRALLRALVRRRPRGPGPEARARGASWVWGEARARDGRAVQARVHGPEGYSLTVDAALAAVARVGAGGVAPGFQTPGTAFGPDFVLSLPGVSREDLP